MTSKQIAEQAIQILDATREELNTLFADIPEMQIRTDNVLKRLINGYAHAEGLPIIDVKMALEHKAEPLTHIAGVRITAPAKKVSVSKSEPTTAETEEMEGFLEMAYEDFQVESAKNLREAYNDLVIRGVAVKAGMPVTPTEPASISVDFIDKIKEAVALEVDRQKQQEPTTPETEEIKPPVKSKNK